MALLAELSEMGLGSAGARDAGSKPAPSGAIALNWMIFERTGWPLTAARIAGRHLRRNGLEIIRIRHIGAERLGDQLAVDIRGCITTGLGRDDIGRKRLVRPMMGIKAEMGSDGSFRVIGYLPRVRRRIRQSPVMSAGPLQHGAFSLHGWCIASGPAPSGVRPLN
jgi:hypothetical protein